jgi:hypothetical protein
VALAELMIPQRHVLGDEGEVDFGTISVHLAGVLTGVQSFIMRLSACGEGFPRAYENECQEVFLDGQAPIFHSLAKVRVAGSNPVVRSKKWLVKGHRCRA